MSRSIFKRACFLSILCVVTMGFVLNLPLECYGDMEPCPMTVEVSPYQVNIDADGVNHYVRVLTYTSYSNTAGAFVYINDNEDPIDSDSIKLTRDSFGHLIVKIDLDALKDADLARDTSHDLTIVAELKVPTSECVEKEGIGEIYIIGKGK